MSSEAFVVRDKIMARLRAMTFFNGFTKFSTNTSEQIQPENVPFLGVYFINEDMTPDGDANVGEVKFKSSATYGISVVVQNNDAAAAENKLDAAWAAFSKIFIDPTLYNWKNVGKPNEVAIQAYTRGNRSHVFGSVGKENAIPIAEMRFNLTCDLGVIDYPPVIDDDFLLIHVKTQYPGGDTQADIDNRQQTEVQYDIPQN
jgi:hypothetical protein